MVWPLIMPRLASRSARFENLPGNPLAGGPAPEVERQLIGLNPLVDPGFRNPVEQIRVLEQERPQIVALELAIGHLGDSLDVTARQRPE